MAELAFFHPSLVVYKRQDKKVHLSVNEVFVLGEVDQAFQNLFRNITYQLNFINYIITIFFSFFVIEFTPASVILLWRRGRLKIMARKLSLCWNNPKKIVIYLSCSSPVMTCHYAPLKQLSTFSKVQMIVSSSVIQTNTLQCNAKCLIKQKKPHNCVWQLRYMLKQNFWNSK